MTVPFVLLNLGMLAIAQWLFFWIAEPASDDTRWIEPLQVWLNLGFAIATTAYFLCFWLLRRHRSRGWRVIRWSVGAIAFFILWSVGIVVATNLAQSPNGATLFYSTSGQQFTIYNSSVIGFCLLIALPVLILNGILNVLLWRWIAPRS